MHLHSTLVSYQRVELTLQAIDSYLATVTLPFSLIVVDNGSSESAFEALSNHQLDHDYELMWLGVNRYPGYATNRGWEQMPPETTHLHRADNDFAYRQGWCEEVLRSFWRDSNIGQVGLRTDEEEAFVPINVGGNNVIKRELWDLGLRYDERPWGRQYPKGWTEDSFFSPAVVKLGYRWARVKRPCLRSLEEADISKPYYEETFRTRGILP